MKSRAGIVTGKQSPGRHTRSTPYPASEPAPAVKANTGLGEGGRGQSEIVEGEQGPRQPTFDDDRKPPYAIPPTGAIVEVVRNGYKVASTFAGAGGSCLGYAWSGWEIAWASELEPNAAEAHARVFPDCVHDARDIREVRGSEIRQALGGEIDLLDGSPPCQSFSTAGRREKGWGEVISHADGTTGRSDDLIFEFSRLVREATPRAFVMENVRGLLVGKAKGLYLELLDEFRAAGYVVSARLLDTQWLGVPQRRVRVIVVGLRSDQDAVMRWPAPFPWRYSVVEACPWISGDAFRHGGRAESQPVSPEVPSGPVQSFTGSVNGSIAAIERRAHGYFGGDSSDAATQPSPTVPAMPGGVGDLVGAGPAPDLEEEAVMAWDGGWHDGKARSPEDVSPAVTTVGVMGAAQARISSGSGKRKLTILECKRLMGFPDDFPLEGSYAQQWARLGNAVAPPMARAVGMRVLEALEAADGRSGAWGGWSSVDPWERAE